jgi:hypothetical protein
MVMCVWCLGKRLKDDDVNGGVRVVAEDVCSVRLGFGVGDTDGPVGVKSQKQKTDSERDQRRARREKRASAGHEAVFIRRREP